ncbi:MAG TPA: serine/threonine-protein kinase [Polyangiaceae bacterium]|nr:serine/threonine-protein kinase [Polyangiaceae bacterium]
MSGAKPIDPRAPAEDAAAPASVGRYLIFDEIGVGGMASVHLGMLTGAVGFRRIVALKQLHSRFIHDPDFVAQFINEARLASHIHHANVVQTIDIVWTGTQLLLVLEYVEGDTLNRVLRSALERGLMVPIEVACGMVAGVLHGLHAAHEVQDEEGIPLDIVHRDVSPQNILVARDGVARVLDFGVAKALAQNPNTQSGLLKGKFGYMAPEQILRGHVDRRTDVFAAGVVLWETLTCRRLFQSSKNVEQALARVVGEPIVAPSTYRPDVPAELDAIVLRAMERDPELRFPSAEALAVALEKNVNVAGPHVIKTWFEPLASPELVQRAELIRTINKRYGPPGRMTPHPSELVEEARAALLAAAASAESTAVASAEPVAPRPAPLPPRRSGKFLVGGPRRRKVDSGIRMQRHGLTPPVSDDPLSTKRNRISPTPSQEVTTPTIQHSSRLSPRNVGGTLLAVVLTAATLVTALGRTSLPPVDPALLTPLPPAEDGAVAPLRPAPLPPEAPAAETAPPPEVLPAAKGPASAPRAAPPRAGRDARSRQVRPRSAAPAAPSGGRAPGVRLEPNEHSRREPELRPRR